MACLFYEDVVPPVLRPHSISSDLEHDNFLGGIKLHEGQCLQSPAAKKATKRAVAHQGVQVEQPDKNNSRNLLVRSAAAKMLDRGQ